MNSSSLFLLLVVFAGIIACVDKSIHERVKEGINHAHEEGQKIGKAVDDNANSLYQGVKDGLDKAGETVHNTVNAVYEGVKDAFDRAGESVHNTVSESIMMKTF
ncbi:hypothetical protein PRIPAC_87621 [Pristionchus pacificus]|uniref:Uncharacterized protein n=1 Tax=Pristionchus pacificus TaxID=54126 RepID=A0A2A6CXL0_PRIPA|nr:hypothetical protein PRIPAC_87621 [Pristionchus pacificus]|eukprot:PDM82761.1 hypothetical protein PRIPAC_37154 [Pristionchus pacificus]